MRTDVWLCLGCFRAGILYLGSARQYEAYLKVEVECKSYSERIRDVRVDQ